MFSGSVEQVKVREVLRLLRDDGWEVAYTSDSHRQLVHPTKLGRVTVAGKRNDDLRPGTLASILRQAGLT
jgi:predicted RNA binding protein YcfA (HicA-like mRNA interferase family)